MDDVVDDRRDVLNGTRTGADRRDSLACERSTVIPLRRVERPAFEGVATGDVRKNWDVQHAEAADQRVGGEDVACLRRELPALAGLVPLGGADRCVGAHVRAKPEVLSTLLEVGEDLRLGGKGARPVRVGSERERVEVGRHIARSTRVGVVAPRSADAVALLVDREVEVGALERDTHRDSACTCSEHGD